VVTRRFAAAPDFRVALNFDERAPVMSAFTCWVPVCCAPGVATRAHRHTGSSVYLAFEGSGATIIDGIRYAWEQGDMFVIPSWAVHEHINASESERAILFSAHDFPLLKALDKFRVAPYESRRRPPAGPWGKFGE